MRLTQFALATTAGLVLAAVTACGTDTGGAPAAGGTSGSAATVTIGLVQAQDFSNGLPSRIADTQGIFMAQGLTVKIVEFTAGSDLTKAMSAGSVDIGAATGLDVVNAAAHDVDLQAFFGVRSKTPMSLIVGTNSPVTSFDTMAGHKIGISKFGSMTDYVVRRIEQLRHLDATTVTPVPLGTPSGNLAALKQGQVDGVILPVDFSFGLVGDGSGKVAASVADLGGADQFSVLMARKSYLSKNRAVVTKLVAAYAKAITFIQQNKPATVAVQQSALGQKANVATKAYDALAPGLTPDGAMDTAGLKAYADALPGLQLATASPAESTYYDPSFVPVK